MRALEGTIGPVPDLHVADLGGPQFLVLIDSIRTIQSGQRSALCMPDEKS